MNIAIIPARGGSKRIPKKNIKKFLGKPIIAYSIDAAHKSELFDKIIVSTDNEEIAQLALKFGAEVPFLRPNELADDFTGTTPVVRHAAQWVEQNIAKPDNICCIYSTAPFVQAQAIKDSFTMLANLSKGHITAITSFSFPIQRAFKLDKDNHPIPFYPEYMPCRSQDLEDAYHDAGQFYWWTYDALINGVSEHKAYQLPPYLVQDIDTLEDWKRAELMYQVLSQEKSC
ncbi:MAG: pseudaminic acid cytidylyltransferase [Gammaproteobacteria bacterium]|nr:pseudaminic acid cytidylyltransferase [Gammaproteobacteria bacterium]